MKNSAISMLTVLLLGAASSIAGFDAETENKVQAGLSKGEITEAMFDLDLGEEDFEDESELNERDLAGGANRKKRQARKAKRAAKKAARKQKRMEARKAKKAGTAPAPAPAPAPEPAKEMYKEIIYMEKECEYYDEQPLNQTFNGTVTGGGGANEIRQPDIGLGDTRSFACDLHEAAIKYGTFGGQLVGRTLWFCQAFGRVIFTELLDTFQEVVWYCTIEDNLEEGATFRNEGLTFGIDEPDPMRAANPTDDDFDNFQSHTGDFATVGGRGAAKGARGSMSVEYDAYKMTWFHVYTVEVWNIEQVPIIPFPH